jgi:hypothetical protein
MDDNPPSFIETFGIPTGSLASKSGLPSVRPNPGFDAGRGETDLNLRREPDLEGVPQTLRLWQRREPLERVVLDLPDPLACDAESASHLVERLRLSAV